MSVDTAPIEAISSQHFWAFGDTFEELSMFVSPSAVPAVPVSSVCCGVKLPGSYEAMLCTLASVCQLSSLPVQ